jgi:tetratricopeptide (TPR) repeat protein
MGMTKLHITISLGLAMLASGTLPAQAEQMFEAANEAYEAGNHQLALDTYESILENHRHFESEFNAGNAAFKLGELGKARVHYERAKLLDASNDNLQANIALLEAKIVDRITPVPNLGLGTWLSTWIGPGQLVGWVVWSLLWWTTAWALWGLRWKKDSPDSRATLAFLGVGSMVLGLVGLWAVQESNARMKSPSQLVIMSDRVDVNSAPSPASTVLFQLHEGTRACILDKSAGWTEIELDNGNVGWVPADATEEV